VSLSTRGDGSIRVLDKLVHSLQLATGIFVVDIAEVSSSASEVRKGHHGAYRIQYHIVFPVKYRKGLLVPEVCQIIEETSEGIAERYAIEFEALGMDSDHMQVLCGAHPKLSPGCIGQIFKRITAREVFRRRSEVRRQL